MGKPSCQILLHEITKLMYHAGVVDPIYIRIGTSGGLGLKPGTVCIATGAVSELLEPYVTEVVCGKVIYDNAQFCGCDVLHALMNVCGKCCSYCVYMCTCICCVPVDSYYIVHVH